MFDLMACSNLKCDGFDPDMVEQLIQKGNESNRAKKLKGDKSKDEPRLTLSLSLQL